MKITDSGVGLSPWRQRVLPLMLLGLRALVSWLVLSKPVELLLKDQFLFAGLAPHWLQYLLAGLLTVGAVLFICSPTVVLGALLTIAGLCAFEYCWRRVAPVGRDSALLSSIALFTALAAGEWLSRRVQRRVYGARLR